MKFIYSTITKEEVQNDIEYPVFVQWDCYGSCNIHMFKEMSEAREAMDKFVSLPRGLEMVPKHFIARVLFTAKKEKTND